MPTDLRSFFRSVPKDTEPSERSTTLVQPPPSDTVNHIVDLDEALGYALQVRLCLTWLYGTFGHVCIHIQIWAPH